MRRSATRTPWSRRFSTIMRVVLTVNLAQARNGTVAGGRSPRIPSPTPRTSRGGTSTGAREQAVVGYRRDDAVDQPPHLHADYVATRLRAPARPLVRIPH